MILDIHRLIMDYYNGKPLTPIVTAGTSELNNQAIPARLEMPAASNAADKRFVTDTKPK